MKLRSLIRRIAFVVLVGCVLGIALFFLDPINRLSLRLRLADSRGTLTFDGPWGGYRATSPIDAAQNFTRNDDRVRIVELRRILLPRSTSAEVYGALVVINYRTTSLLIVHEHDNEWLVRGF